MKRLILTAAILSIIIAVCFVGVSTVAGCVEEMSGSLKNAAALCERGDYSGAKAAATELEARWVEIEPRLSIFINHDTVTTVGESVSRLAPLADEDNAAEFIAECRDAEISLVHIRENERLSIFNIF